MPHLCQLVGVIEMDADSGWGTHADGTLGDTLARLRSESRSSGDHWAAAHGGPWRDTDASLWNADQVLEADLRQLRTDLEIALRLVMLCAPRVGLPTCSICRQ